MISNTQKYFVISVFILFLFVGMIFTMTNIDETHSWFENRNLNVSPELSYESVMDGSYFSKLEKFLIDRSAARNILLRIKTLSDEIIFRRPSVNDTVIDENVLLMYRDYVYSNTENYSVDWYINELSEFNEIVKSYGGYFCYVGVPTQYNFYAEHYPDYLENMADETCAIVSDLANAAEKYGVPYLDMGQIMESADNSDSLFFKTDHHYTLRGAYLTYASIIDKINRDCKTDISYPSETNGEIIFNELPNKYYGSHSRKIFGLTDISERLLYATFESEIPYKRYDNGAESYPYVYANPANENENVLYSFYMGGDIAETVIDTDREELPSILIYGDSFTNALECIAYYSFDEMRSVDLRHYNDMTLAEYAEKYRPDYVICIRDYDNLIMPYFNGDVFGKLK